MIGFLKGEVLFSDGSEAIVGTPSGIGYEVCFSEILTEGADITLYTSHIIRENAQLLYGFRTLREKKLFELLVSVKGVGPKSAYGLLMALGFEQTVGAIQREDKKALSKAPGIGPKAAAQVVLDLGPKIEKVVMYSENYQMGIIFPTQQPRAMSKESATAWGADSQIVHEAVMACKELGFKEESIEPIIHRLVQENSIAKPEQLVHLVLKEV